MKRFAFYFGIFLLLTIGACSIPYFISDNFEEDTADHEMIAILPFEMIYTGLRPAKLTDEEFEEIELTESRIFQISFFNEILRSTKQGRKPIRVVIQNPHKTLQLLEENGIGIKDSWYIHRDTLAELLGADAVVSASIEKSRLMPDLVSLGIEVANVILDMIFQGSVSSQDPTAKIVYVSYALLDRDEEEILWSISFEASADWSSEANKIISDINRQGAKKFPYRIK